MSSFIDHEHPVSNDNSLVLGTALEAWEAGFSLLPIAPANSSGDKRPSVPSWKEYQTQRASLETIKNWFTNNTNGLAVIMGEVSGNLIMLELEGYAKHKLSDLARTADSMQAGILWQKVMTGWWEQSPSGGYHWYMKIEDGAPASMKLARAKATSEQLETNPNQQIYTLAEIKGEKGYSVIAPTPGRFHHTGRPWRILAGGPKTAPTITLDELETLKTIFATLNTFNTPTKTPTITTSNNTSGRKTLTPRTNTNSVLVGISPGDDFEQKTSWEDILTPHGWVLDSVQGTLKQWRRPGKTHGISATTGYADDRERIYVFSTSTIFDAETPYTKLAAFAMLNFGGDFHKTVSYLLDQGYGTRGRRGLEVDVPYKGGLESVRNTPSASSGSSVSSGLDSSRPGGSNPDNLRGSGNETDAEAGRGNMVGETSANDQNKQLASSDTGGKGVVGFKLEDLTEDANALLFANAYHDRWCYIPERNSWACWDGHKWMLDTRGQVMNVARALARNYPTPDKSAYAHRKHSLTRTGLTATLALAQCDARIAHNLADFDTNPYELNTPGGIVDLKTGKISPPNPKKYCLRATSVAPVKGEAPLWDKFLQDTFKNQPELIDYMQQLAGITLIGKVTEQIFPFLHGQGANGKTTLINIWQQILGTGQNGYSTNSPSEMLINTNQNRHPAEIAALQGVRMSVCAEIEDGQRFAESKIKLLTGADNITARFMGKNFFTFTPTHTLFLVGNHEPEVKGGGVSFWRRLRKIPFTNIVPKEKRDPELENKIYANEAPQILAWMIQGAQNYLSHGLKDPSSVIVATKEYEHEQDHISLFIEECCKIGHPEMLKTTVSEVRATYETWCRRNGYEPVSAKAITQQLKTKGVEIYRSNGIRYYSGLRVISNEKTPEDKYDDLYYMN